MNWFLHSIAVFFNRLLELVRSGTRGQNRREELYASGGDRQLIMGSPGEGADGRRRTVHIIGPRASSDGIGGESEYFTYVDEKGTQTEIDYRVTRRCDCGALIGYKDVSLLGTCGICARTVCSQAGCSSRCGRCGMLVCARHAVRLEKHAYCSHHRWYGLWMLFWGLLE